jgi:hypothetical protein
MRPAAVEGTPTKIRALRDPLLLCLDKSPESAQVKKLLEVAGVSHQLTDCRLEPLQRKPLVLFGAGIYQGLEQVQGLVRLLAFWSSQPIEREIFLSPAQADALRK